MYKTYYSIHTIVVLTLLMLVSCKKDKDITGPSIEIFSPAENQTFNVNDVITVSGNISDDHKIENASISLLDAQQIVAHISVSIPITSVNTDFSVHYALDNIHLETGIYYLMVTASDGENETRKYRKIYIVAVPKVLEKIFIVSNTGNSQTNWSYTDSNFSALLPFTNFSGDYIGSSASSYYQQLFNCGNYTGNFSSYNLTTNLIKFTVPTSVSANPYFTGYTTAAENMYIARYDEFIKGYNYKGDAIFNSSSLNGYYTKHFIFNGGVMIAEQQNKINASKLLVTYYTTGSIDVQTSLNQDVVTMLEKNNTNVFLFGNVAGQGVIQLFDRINNNLWNPYPFSLAAGTILSAVKIDNDTYLIGHSNGTIYKYQYTMSSVTTYATGYTAKQLKFDSETNKLYVVENNKVACLNYATAGYLNSITSGENILDVHLVYNR